MTFVSAVLRTVGGIVGLIDRRVDERLENDCYSLSMESGPAASLSSS